MSRPNPIEEILGKITAPPSQDEEKAARAELQAEASEPEGYRPYLIRARAQMGCTIITADGTRRGFQYHTLRNPKHERRDGAEQLSWTADGMAYAMEGQGLVILHAALVRGTLAEVRQYDGKRKGDNATCIDTLQVIDTRLLTDADRERFA